MQIKKKDATFNLYTLEVSFGELTAMANALEDAFPGPIVDELLAGLRWYIDHLPAPGEDKEDFKAKQDAEKQLKAQATEEPAEAETGGPPIIAAEKNGPDLEPKAKEPEDQELPEPPTD